MGSFSSNILNYPMCIINWFSVLGGTFYENLNEETGKELTEGYITEQW